MCFGLVTWNEELDFGRLSDAFEGDHDFFCSQTLAAIIILKPIFAVTFVMFREENDWQVQTISTYWCFHFQNTSTGQERSRWSLQMNFAVR